MADAAMAASPAAAVPQWRRACQPPARPTPSNEAPPPAGVGSGKPGAMAVRAYHSGHDGFDA